MTRAPASGRLLAVALVAAVVLQGASAGDALAASKKKKRKKPTPTAVPRPPDPFRVTIPTADGVSLAASWRPVPDRPGAPAVLLLHDFSRERRDWEELAPEFTARGLATLAIDLRAHGESTRKNGARLVISPRQMSDPNGFPRDVEAACRWLRERSGKTGIVGLSLGGNLAILASAEGLADAVVVVSANSERLAPLAGGRSSTAHAALFIASEEAPDREKSAQALFATAADPKELLIVPGTAHNLVLFSEDPETKTAMLDWLVERLGAAPPTAPAPASSPAGPPE
ncbi:MAG: alpha/beta hydrolase [Acidithiobacillales bacterium]